MTVVLNLAFLSPVMSPFFFILDISFLEMSRVKFVFKIGWFGLLNHTVFMHKKVNKNKEIIIFIVYMFLKKVYKYQLINNTFNYKILLQFRELN